jgi:transposase
MTSLSVIACASKDGWSSYKTIKGGVNRLAFCEFIKSLSIPKGSVMLLDNASIHRGDIVKETFLEMGIIPLYVPPYSPWYNPIENCFSSVKRNFLEKEDVDFAMQNLTVDGHFIPYFRRGLACNGFDDADAMANLAPHDSDDDVASQTNPSFKKTTLKRQKSVATTTTSDKMETLSKNKNSVGDTVTIKTITMTVTTIRKKWT